MPTQYDRNETELIREFLKLSRYGETWIMAVETEVDPFLDMLNLLKTRRFRYNIISKNSYLRMRKAGVPSYKVEKLTEHA